MTADTHTATDLNIQDIMRTIPHRYHLRLIDRIIDIVPGESATALKNVTMNEPHFQGHFPGAPVMPGVLIIEAMAQTAAISVVRSLGKDAEGKLVYFMTIDNCRFRKPVVPGDQLQIHVRKTQNRRNVWKFEGKAMIDGETLSAEAVLSAMLLDERAEKL